MSRVCGGCGREMSQKDKLGDLTVWLCQFCGRRVIQ